MSNNNSHRRAVSVAALSFIVGIASAGEIRVACYSDGNECEVTQDLAKRFEAQNADVKVAIDKVPYKAIVEQLPVQLAAGEGPDIARVTDLGGLSKYYLDITPYVKDPKYWEASFGQTLKWLRPTPTDKGIYGMMTQLTVTGPFVNKTLFDQAKVALPGPNATWDDWAAATRQVAKATQVPFAMAFDPFDLHDVAVGKAVDDDPRGADIFKGTPYENQSLKKYRFAYLANFTTSYVQLLDLDSSFVLLDGAGAPSGDSSFETIVYTLGEPKQPKVQ